MIEVFQSFPKSLILSNFWSKTLCYSWGWRTGSCFL